VSNRRKFLLVLFFVQFLVWIQRSLRLLTRAAWLGLGGYLVGLAGSLYWPILENPTRWILVGLGFASLPLIGLLFAVPRQKKLVWSIDRKLGYKEQVSTAWSVRKSADLNPLTAGLMEDAAFLARQTFNRLLLKGWVLERDLISLAVVFLLAGMIIQEPEEILPLPVLESGARQARLPAAIDPPTAGDIFPNGMLGMDKNRNSSSVLNVSDVNGSKKSLTDEEKNMLSRALTEMGDLLSSRMSTYEVGQELLEGDLESAAVELEKLADQLEHLSQETKTELAQAMQTASEMLESQTLEQFAQSLEQASNSLAESSAKQRQQRSDMDSVASEMRKLAEAFGEEPADDQAAEGLQEGSPGEGLSAAGGAGTTSSQVASPEKFERVGGSGQVEVFELPEKSATGILIPGDALIKSSEVAAGQYNYRSRNAAGSGKLPVIPHYYPWYMRNVVEGYFQSTR
jgi:hypothetical protein